MLSPLRLASLRLASLRLASLRLASLRLASLASLLLLHALPLTAQVTVKKGAVIYQGSASNTTAPATVNECKVKEATAEWKKIQAEGIDTDSAQGKQLLVQMNNRIREAIKDVAKTEKRDMVTR